MQSHLVLIKIEDHILIEHHNEIHYQIKIQR